MILVYRWIKKPNHSQLHSNRVYKKKIRLEKKKIDIKGKSTFLGLT